MKISKEVKAGLIGVFAIIGFVLMFQFMKGKNWFTTDNVFYAKYDNVEGLEPSSPVSINGLKVGQVDEIKPLTDSNGKLYFVVKVTVDDNYEFSKRSSLEVFEPGLMSGKEMRINLAYGEPLAKDGDTLAGSFKLSMMNSLSSQIGPVKDQFQSLLKRVDSLANSANQVFDKQNREEIRLLLANLNRTVSAYEVTSKNVNTLLANNDGRVQKVLDHADEVMKTANTTVAHYQQVDVQKLNTTITSLDGTVKDLNSVILGIQNGQGSLGKLAKDEQLYNNLTETSKNLNELVTDLKANPKRYLNFSVFGKNSKE